MRGAFERDEREPAQVRAATSPTGTARADSTRTRPSTGARREPLVLPRGDAREPVRTSRATYHMHGAEVRTLLATGTFRSVMTRDVVRFIYAGNAAAWSRDLRNLEKQGLIQRRIPDGTRARQPEVLTLTPVARMLLNAARPVRDASPQRFYSGVIKPRELAHDAAIYRMAEYERARIESQGGRITRVLLDTELKASVYRAWDAASHGTRDAATKQQVADAHDVPIVNGRIQFPDVRLEIEQADGTRDHVDLELATRHYHRAHLQAKAGFRMYVPRGDDLVARIMDV